MKPTHWAGTLVCPKCKGGIGVVTLPIIDPVKSLAKYQSFLAGASAPRTCARCEGPLSANTPIVVNMPKWVGVALENPYPITAVDTLSIVAEATEYLDVPFADPPMNVLVVGRADELRRIIANGAGDRFCAMSLGNVAMRNHGNFIEMLRGLADAYANAGQPEDAYWMLTEAVGMFGELYFLPEMQDLMEMMALAAGNRIGRGLKVPQTAGSHFAMVQSKMESQRPGHVPAWCRSTYLCFYEKGPHPKWSRPVREMWSAVVNLVGLDKSGALGLAGAERHQVFLPQQAVAQEELSIPEQAREYMLFLMLSSGATRKLPALPTDVREAVSFSTARLATKWEEMGFFEKRGLASTYHKMTGRDFRAEFRL